MVSNRMSGFLEHRFGVLWEGFDWAAKSSRPDQGAQRRRSGKETDHAGTALRLVRPTSNRMLGFLEHRSGVLWEGFDWAAKV